MIMKIFKVKKEHLVEYVENKKAEKIYYDIMEDIHKNMKFLNENVSLKNANQTVINDYLRKDLINSRVFEMLVKHKIINEKYEII